MSPKKQEKNSPAIRNSNTQNDVQKRYQQDFSRYKQQIERVTKVAGCPKAA